MYRPSKRVPLTSHETPERVKTLLCELEAALPVPASVGATARGGAQQLEAVVAELMAGGAGEEGQFP